jgi:hypothetical protein
MESGAVITKVDAKNFINFQDTSTVMFDSEMQVISDVMKTRLVEKQDKHGDEWKEASLDHMRDRVDFIYEVLMKRRATELEPISMIDMANQCMLLYLRLMEHGKKG